MDLRDLLAKSDQMKAHGDEEVIFHIFIVTYLSIISNKASLATL